LAVGKVQALYFEAKSVRIKPAGSFAKILSGIRQYLPGRRKRMEGKAMNEFYNIVLHAFAAVGLLCITGSALLFFIAVKKDK